MGPDQLVHRHRRQHRHAAPLFERDKHLGRAVLQSLVAADRLPELLAGFQVFQGHRLHRFHRADRLGGHGRDAGLDDALDDRKRAADLAEHGVGATSTALSVISAARVASRSA